MMQADLFAARERGKTGSRRASERADRAVDGWTEMAAQEIREYAQTTPQPFLVETARLAGFGGDPPDERAWGHATRLAVKRGWIKKVGYAPAASSNGSPKCLWAKA